MQTMIVLVIERLMLHLMLFVIVYYLLKTNKQHHRWCNPVCDNQPDFFGTDFSCFPINKCSRICNKYMFSLCTNKR